MTMSHANGQVRFQDGLILHYEYDGTCDIVIPSLWKTHKEVWEHWRNQPDRRCDCGNDEAAEIGCDYAYGSYWPGKACRHCMCVTDGLRIYLDEPPYEKAIDVLPAWWAK